MLGLLDFCRSEKSKSENFLIVSTEEMYKDIKSDLDTFCEKSKILIQTNCFKEKTEESFKHGLFAITIQKEIITKHMSDIFPNIHKSTNNSFYIPITDILEYDNNSELRWFLKKIEGVPIIQNKPDKINYSINLFPGTLTQTHYVFESPEYRPSSTKFSTVAQKVLSDDNAKAAYHIAKISISLDPENSVAEYVLGQSSAFISDYSLAVKHFKNAERINFNFVQAALQLGHAYIQIHEFEKASGTFGYIAQLNYVEFDDNEALQFLVDWTYACIETGDLDLASDILMDANPQDFNSMNSVAALHIQLKEYDNALNYLQRSIDLGESDLVLLSKTHIIISHIYLQKYLSSKSQEYLEKCNEHIVKSEKCIEKTQELPEDNLQKANCSKIKEAVGEIRSIVLKEMKNVEFLDIPESSNKLVSGSIESISESYNKNQQIRTYDISTVDGVNRSIKEVQLPRIQRALCEFIRKKYDGKIDKFKKEFETNYVDAAKLLDSNKNNPTVKYMTDVFDCLDFKDFYYIIRTKNFIDSKIILNNLSNIQAFRNILSHFKGTEDYGDLDIISANSCYHQCLEVLDFFKKLQSSS